MTGYGLRWTARPSSARARGRDDHVERATRPASRAREASTRFLQGRGRGRGAGREEAGALDQRAAERVQQLRGIKTIQVPDRHEYIQAYDCSKQIGVPPSSAIEKSMTMLRKLTKR